MALDNQAKKEFIDGMVEDFKNQIGPGAKQKTLDGMRDYSTKLCERIVALIKKGDVVVNLDNSGTVRRPVE